MREKPQEAKYAVMYGGDIEVSRKNSLYERTGCECHMVELHFSRHQNHTMNDFSTQTILDYR